MYRIIKFGLLAVLPVFAACSSYNPTKETDEIALRQAKEKEFVVTRDSITVRFFPFINDDLSNLYMGVSPKGYRMIPSLLRVENNSSQYLMLNLDKCALEMTSESYEPLTLELGIHRARRHVNALLILCGFIPYLIDASAVSDANIALEQDYYDKYFKPALINPGASGEGIIFNKLPKQRNISYKNCTLSLSMTEVSSKKDRIITVQVPDSILADWQRE